MEQERIKHLATLPDGKEQALRTIATYTSVLSTPSPYHKTYGHKLAHSIRLLREFIRE